MSVNPFVFDRPLPPDQLVDRSGELEQLLGLAIGGQSVRLGAPRRYGKTTLLGALAQTAWSAHEMIPATVDLSGVLSVGDLAARIVAAYERQLDRGRLRAAWRSIRRHATATGTLALPGVGGVSTTVAGRPEDDLAQLHAALELPVRVHERTGQRCLVILDEFQDLLTAGDGLDGVLRSHLQHHHDVASYVFAGSQPSLMRALFDDRRRPLFEQARAIELGRLPGPELGDWIDERLGSAGREGLRDLVDAVVATSEGHPQRAMLLAHFLFEQDDDDAEAFDRALDAAMHEAADGLEATWRALPAPERRLLGAVAAGHPLPTSAAALEFTGMSKTTQVGVRDRLLAAAHLEPAPEGGVRFVDPFFARWLRR